ncbi:MAG: GGDEF domain-containing protein [Nonlabens ulvanivorans]|uniref:GGDEF domain-containing protein n=1 Tax=Nonlabens ulvanivorans TaxID=906888 RepID=UPI0032646217
MKHARLTNALLNQHQLAPTPINYSVFFIYIKGTTPALTQEVESLIESNEINDTSINQLYELYVSQITQIDEEILSPLSQSINLVLDKLKQQVNSEEQAVTNLQKIDKVLSQSKQNSSLQQIINYVQSTVNGSVTQHKSLSLDLNKTNDEINELKAKLSEAKQDAISDPLTGFLNRRGGDEKLAEIDIDEKHTTLIIDIDHFKLINDNFGHPIGDKVIQKVTQLIRKQLSDKDITVRYGGEEFVVVAVNKTLYEAQDIAEKIRLAISQLKLKQKNSDKFLPKISVSIGIAENKNERYWQDIIERADKALYEAKNSGRNCIKIAA